MRESPDKDAASKGEMASVEMFDVVHAPMLRYFPDVVRQLGGDPLLLLKQSGIVIDAVQEDEATATYRQLVDLIERSAADLQCRDFGMRLASMQRGRSMFGPLGRAMQNSATFGGALNYVVRHSFAHSLAARIWIRRYPEEQAHFIGHDILLDGMPNKAQAMEQILLLGHLSALDITGGYARARRIHFRHQPISPLIDYRRYFGCEVYFAQNEDGIYFADRDLACPIVESDANAYQSVTSYIDAQFTRHRPPLSAEARGIVMQLLGSGECTNERVADELNLHPRTLHRRLKAEGTSFQQVKDAVRRDIMLYYLEQTQIDFALISERLGFSEQSVMTRTCNRWFNGCPTKVRSQSQDLAA